MMNPQPLEIPRVRIDPIGCVAVGWEIIKPHYWLYLGITFVGSLIAGSVAPFLIGPMTCGMYLCMLEMMRGNPIEFGTLFKGFDYFLHSLVACLIPFGIVCAMIGPLYVMMIMGTMGMGVAVASEAPGAALLPMMLMGLLFFLFIGIAVLVSLCSIFSYALVVDRGLPGHTALWVSAKAVFKNFWGTLGLTLVIAILSILGLLCCYVGAFFV
ncbi:MAG: hypothetical protein AAF492_18280, partial [Verrucomicrobiota bacterium]